MDETYDEMVARLSAEPVEILVDRVMNLSSQLDDCQYEAGQLRTHKKELATLLDKAMLLLEDSVKE